MSRTRFRCSSCPLGLLLVVGAPAPANAVPCYGVQQPFCVYPNNPGVMIDDVGPLRLGTTFQFWPDGSATIPGQQLTPDMNFTSIGVTFSAQIGYPFIRAYGPSFQYRGLEANTGGTFQPDWIIADFVTPASAIGIYFPGGTTIYAYDSNGALIGDGSYYFSGSDLFLGVASDTPIARAIINRGSDTESVDSFGFNIVPEPALGLVLGLAAPISARRLRRRMAA